MTIPAAVPAPPRAATGHAKLEGGLIPQPERPSQFPIRVPVTAECGGALLKADVLGSTENVLLMQGPQQMSLPPLGTPLRMRVEWDRQLLNGRIAAHGVAGRFLVSLGERAIRRSRRFPVNLPGTAKSAHLYGPVEVRVADLSTGGARIEGIELPVGTDLELRFTPPGQPGPINVLGFVVRAIAGSQVPSVGVAFRLAQPSVEVLGNASASAS